METAEYAPALHRDRIQADAVCYARAVRLQERPAMSGGTGSPAPSVWSTSFRETFETLEGKTAFGMLVAADNQRTDEREERLTQGDLQHPQHHLLVPARHPGHHGGGPGDTAALLSAPATQSPAVAARPQDTAIPAALVAFSFAHEYRGPSA
ncbi:hypothetical protein [Streptomyces sp. NPDC058486]|uniref:hypothetical protein n=1 Tax=unclassified Streptomyces TaxID=2593676 RepID=UPI00365724FF